MCQGSTTLEKWIHYVQEVKQARKDILPGSGTWGRCYQESKKQEEWSNLYRPQTKFAKVMFLHLSVSHSVDREGSASVHAGIPYPPAADTPPEQRPPGSRHPPEQTPLGADTPWSRHPPGPGTTPSGPGTPLGAETATAADGMHPTGMHSCWSFKEKTFVKQSQM